MILRFTGHPVPGYVERALRADLAAGAILFDDNAPTRGAVRAVSRRLQRAAGGDALISTDQEGGAIRRLHWGAPKSGQAALAAPGDAANAARAAARSLRRAGLNLNFAPVADVATAGSVMRGRAYAGSSAAVARLTGAAVRAYRGTGVIPAVKHFPGLGAATVNTDDAGVTIDRSSAALAAVDLPPFQAAIAAGVPVVMVSHARYPTLDRQRVASQSSAIIGNLLRDRMGFRGVVITDSLEAAAVRAAPEQAAVRSMRAGADLILTTGAGSHLRVVRALTAEARRSRKFRARLTVAAARVRALRASLRE